MATFKNYYHILGLEPFADAESVKSSFRRLARQFHPDLNAGNRQAEEKFKEINEAYDILSDPVKRAKHDAALKLKLGLTPKSGNKNGPPPKAKTTASPPGAGNGKAAEAGKTAPPPKKPPEDGSKKAKSPNIPINELFETFLKKGFEAAREAEEGVFRKPADGGSKGKREETPRRGEDVVVQTAITPQEAAEGVVKTVNVQHNEICRRCSGTGKVNGAICTACNGEKITVRLKKIDVRIPAGVKNGSRVRVAKEGGRGSGGGDPGDLFLQIEITYDPSLRIDGLDVHGEVSISVTDAVLGAEIEVPTLNGPVKMTIPPGTQTGRTFRLKERGVVSGMMKGDHLVTVTVVVPENLSAREKELYHELARLRPEKPAPRKPK